VIGAAAGIAIRAARTETDAAAASGPGEASGCEPGPGTTGIGLPFGRHGPVLRKPTGMAHLRASRMFSRLKHEIFDE